MLRSTLFALVLFGSLLPLPSSIRAQQTQQNASAQPPMPPVIGMRRAQRQGFVTNGANTTGWVQTETRTIANDPHRAYTLLGPGGRGYTIRRRITLGTDGKFTGAGSKEAPNDLPSAGLLVVLPPAKGESAPAMQFWSDVMRNVLKGRYYVAVVAAPRWTATQPSPWLTEATIKQVKEAQFTTETFVKEIVDDVASIFNIDPQRTFLHGAAESGLAVYACSLAEKSPFKGFYIHDAPFRSAQLPPLAGARGKRYFLQQSQDDKTGPMWMAEAARKLLADRGAAVKLASYHGTGAYNFADSDNRWEHLTEALTWLESSAQTTAKPK